MLFRAGFQFINFLKTSTVLSSAFPKSVRTREYFDNMKRACVLVASGSEEMETVITVDILRRGGIIVDLTGITNAAPVECSRQVIIQPDTEIDVALKEHYDIVVLPGGGKGAEAFCASDKVKKLLEQQEKEDKYIAAICAAPTAIVAHSIYLGKVLTCYPSMADIIRKDGRYKYAECHVVIDDKVITSRGPGTTFAFGLKIVEKLVGIEKAKEVAVAMLVNYPDCMQVNQQ